MFRVTSALPMAALVLLVTVTGCTSGAGPVTESESAATTREFETDATPTWTVDASLVGPPAAADGVVLGYVKASSGALQITAWDATTGDELWSDNAATGAVTPGVVVTSRIIEDGEKHFATYLRPADDRGWQDLVLADLATGTEVALADNRVWATSRPSTCADDADVCFTGWKQSAYESGALSYRFASTGGDIVPDTDLVLPPSARLLGNHVYSTNSRPPEGTELLGSTSGGRTLWERAYVDVFGAGTSSDGGWAWHEDDATKLLLGTGAVYDAATRDTAEFSIDATQKRTVALDPQSGETVWSIDGADFCDGDVREAELVDGKRTLCLYRAGSTSIVMTADGTGYESTSTDFDVDLIGVDVASGDIDWTLPLGGEQFNGDSQKLGFASSSAEQVMLVEGVPTVVNVVTGDHTETSIDGTYACSALRDPFLAVFPGSTTGERKPFGAGADYEACDASGTVTDAFSTGSVRMIGVDTDNGYAVIAGPGTLLGFAVAD